MQQMVARTMERQLVAAARDVMVAADQVTALDEDLPFAADEDVYRSTKDAPEENPQERKWMHERMRPARQEDSSKLANQMQEGTGDLDHALRWLVSYYKALKPSVERFTRRMIKSDPANMTEQHVNQLAGVVRNVLKLAEVLDAAGATASDLTETIQSLEKQLKFKSSDDARQGLKRWF